MSHFLSEFFFFIIPLLFFGYTTFLYPKNIYYVAFWINFMKIDPVHITGLKGSVVCVGIIHAFSLLHRILSMNIPQFIHSTASDLCFQYLTMTNMASVNILVPCPWPTEQSKISLQHMGKSRIARSHVIGIFNFTKVMPNCLPRKLYQFIF